MSNELATITDDMFSDARVQMIRDQVAVGAPDYIFSALIDIAKRRKLDPLSKQISLIKFGGKWTIITTIDGYRALAEQTGQYAGSDAPEFTYADPPKMTAAKKVAPESCTVTVYKLINNHRGIFSATVYFEEYSTNQNNWSTMPRTMLAKVAESHALRKAFPAVMSGLYTSEEMDQATAATESAVPQRVDRTTGEIHNAPPRPTQAPPRQQSPTNRETVSIEVGTPFTPPKVDAFYDGASDPNPEQRAEVVQRYVLALKDAGMTDEHRHAIAWAKGYDGSTTNVPTEELVKWTTGIKKHGPIWKQNAEGKIALMKSQQEQLNFQESSEYRDDDIEAAIFDITPDYANDPEYLEGDDEPYEGQYEEVED